MRTFHALIAALLGMALVQGCARGGSTPPPAAQTESAAPQSAQQEQQQVTSEELVYSVGDKSFKGFLARPVGATEKRPGVLVVHEWWGLNDYVRSRARMLAELGYVALAIDMYGDGKSTEHPEDAKAFMMEVAGNREEGARRFDAGLSALRARPEVNADKVAAIGYCFGGAVVLGAARRGVDLDLVASFHGNYATPAPMAKDVFGGKLFIAHGSADTFVTPAQLEGFKQELQQAGVRHDFVIYEGAKHGFTNPDATAMGQRAGIDLAYDAAADAASWSALKEQLAEAFGGT